MDFGASGFSIRMNALSKQFEARTGEGSLVFRELRKYQKDCCNWCGD
ncbi:hypothetical protein RchiOBHm_Chr2g0136611 [Rosa chinensis]|uniref:Uncharacterized protein n=1 Tax=Rosa chinensis TaxID=74649 RepID=A0A2P6RWC8_ROSCH|nr:hypothetical protein RchiOBHm_Chr2g0136611 [Rosa chinensis]